MSRVLAAVSACCGLLLAGCLGLTGAKEVPPDFTDETFIEQVSTLMNNRDYDAVIDLARGYRVQAPEGSRSTDLTLLVEADAQRLSGDPEGAWALFQTISPDPYPAPWTRTGMDILYDLGRRDEAYDFCARNIPRIPQYYLQQGVRQMCIRRSMQ